MASFLLALSLQYGFYHLLLRRPLATRDTALVRPAIGRWLRVVILWQVLVVATSATYVAVFASAHTRGLAWVAPAIGAVFGTALPLQLAVFAILRAGRGA